MSKTLVLLIGSIGASAQLYASNLSDAKNSMYLGPWKQSISNRMMPRYFEHINELKSLSKHSYNSPSLFSLSAFNTQKTWLSKPVYFNQQSLELLDSASRLSFSFHSELIEAKDIALNNLLAAPGFKPKSKLNLNSEFVNQQLYAPGYRYSLGWASFGMSAVFVQQNFIDDTFGFLTLEAQQTSAVYNDPVLYETSRGLGYQVSFSQKLPLSIQLDVDYQSKIEMNEFDTFGKSYSQGGDYDIPEFYSLSFKVPLMESNSLTLKAQEIVYSQVSANLHSGFSSAFLSVMNSPVRPSFEWDDLTVYSLTFERNMNDFLNWNLGVTSRQQAQTLSNTLNTILNNDTADLSYKLGLSTALAGGHLEFFTSYAEKPVFIGRTDFGRFFENNLDRHIEAGLSWKSSF